MTPEKGKMGSNSSQNMYYSITASFMLPAGANKSERFRLYQNHSGPCFLLHCDVADVVVALYSEAKTEWLRERLYRASCYNGDDDGSGVCLHPAITQWSKATQPVHRERRTPAYIHFIYNYCPRWQQQYCFQHRGEFFFGFFVFFLESATVKTPLSFKVCNGCIVVNLGHRGKLFTGIISHVP